MSNSIACIIVRKEVKGKGVFPLVLVEGQDKGYLQAPPQKVQCAKLLDLSWSILYNTIVQEVAKEMAIPSTFVKIVQQYLGSWTKVVISLLTPTPIRPGKASSRRTSKTSISRRAQNGKDHSNLSITLVRRVHSRTSWTS